MGIPEVLVVLNGTNALFGIALKIRDWFRSATNAQNIYPALKAALSKLPKNASATDIVEVLQPFYAAKGGDIALKAGDDGGGDFNLTQAELEAGSGPGGGGNVSITGGDGGPHGKGGDFNIVGGKIKGGSAK